MIGGKENIVNLEALKRRFLHFSALFSALQEQVSIKKRYIFQGGLCLHAPNPTAPTVLKRSSKIDFCQLKGFEITLV